MGRPQKKIDRQANALRISESSPVQQPKQGIQSEETKIDWRTVSVKLTPEELDAFETWAKEEVAAGVKTSRHDIMRRILRGALQERAQGGNPLKRVEETVTRLAT